MRVSLWNTNRVNFGEIGWKVSHSMQEVIVWIQAAIESHSCSNPSRHAIHGRVTSTGPKAVVHHSWSTFLGIAPFQHNIILKLTFTSKFFFLLWSSSYLDPLQENVWFFKIVAISDILVLSVKNICGFIWKTLVAEICILAEINYVNVWSWTINPRLTAHQTG